MVVIPVNELSFKGHSDRTDRELLEQFGRTLRAFRSVVPEHRTSEITFGRPDTMAYAPRLPGGNSVSKIIDSMPVENDERTLLLVLFDFPGLSCEASDQFLSGGEPACGLGHALRFKTLAVSLAVASWMKDEIRVESVDASVLTGSVANAWRAELGPIHRDALRAHIPVLPRYHDPGIHDPKRDEYVKGKSIIPRYASRLLLRAEYHERGWWTKCECGFLHRFARQDPTHWNGTTDLAAADPTPDHEVPHEIRQFWKNRSGVEDCGCHRQR